MKLTADIRFYRTIFPMTALSILLAGIKASVFSRGGYFGKVREKHLITLVILKCLKKETLLAYHYGVIS